MSKLIKYEIKKMLKSKKNKLLLLTLVILIIGVNLYYRGKYNSYIDELEKETSILYNSAQIRVNNAKTELNRLDSEEDIIKLALERKYGSLKKAEEMRPKFEEEIERNMKESNYVKASMVLEKKLVARQMKSKGKSPLDNEDFALDKLLNYKIERINNILEADREGLVPESSLKLKKITIDDIRRKGVYYDYLLDNNLSFDVNPYTSTGVSSTVRFLGNNIIILIFTILIFLSMDLFLSEVEEGSYKIAYTQPYKKNRIFVSKIVAMILFTTLVLIALFSLSFSLNAILNGLGSFKDPAFISENINKISLNNKNIEFKIISIGKNLLLSVILFLTVIFLNIAFISFLSIFTDSSSKTMGIEISVIVLSLLFKKFVSPTNIVHGLSPISYIFTQDVLSERYNTSYILGVLLNLGLSVILLWLSCKKFTTKDFLGSIS